MSSKIRFVAFKGISLVSKIIRWWTRSPYSHIAFLDNGHLVEVWKHDDGFYWSRTPMWGSHTPGTPVEIWEKEVSPIEAERVKIFLNDLAANRSPYDWEGLFGFVLKTPDDKNKYFCSEGCAKALVEAGIWPKELQTGVIHPGYFIQLLLVSGFKKIREMTI